jgi:DNA-directed RNA polymerase subunit RPC12/RpoP
LAKPNNTWKYRGLIAKFYLCSKCGAKFREYSRDGKHEFTLMFKDGKYRKMA